jgi:hypothetical protein
MVGVESRRDHTAVMREFTRRRVLALAVENLSGYVLKSRSPSCGPTAVPRFAGPGDASPVPDRGLFAQELMRRFPQLPVGEEAGLTHRFSRERFVVRVFAYRDWSEFLARRFTWGRLAVFHGAHRDLVAAWAPAAVPGLDALAERAAADGVAVRAPYGRRFLDALARPEAGRDAAASRRAARIYLGFGV